MLKFKSYEDKVSFLTEINRLEYVDTKEADLPIELCEVFFKKNKQRVKNLVDFKKSQDTSRQWRTNKWAMMKGINKFHRSIEGKRFHRSLGRFIATRLFEPQKYDQLPSLRAESAKAISSLRTHLYIEAQYYRPLDDDADFEIFMEEAIPVLASIETKVYENDLDNISEKEFELVVYLTEDSSIKNAVKGINTSCYEKIVEKCDSDLIAELFALVGQVNRVKK